MSKIDAFATIRRAREIGKRHPGVPAHAALVALALATYADGRSGTSIRPSFARISEETGLSPRMVSRGVAWLEAHQELRRDKDGHRGSAACFTFVGGKDDAGDTLSSRKGDTGAEKDDAGVTPPTRPADPSGPSRPSGIAEPGEPQKMAARFTCAHKDCENEVRHERDWCAPCRAEWDARDRAERAARARQPIPEAWMNVEGG